MEATVKDMREAWIRAQEFINAKNEAVLLLNTDSEYSNCTYCVVKLPYGENIELLHSYSWHGSVLHPGVDLKYSGFYSRQTQQFYNIREPLSQFIKFDGVTVFESELKRMVRKAVQQAVAERINEMSKEFKELPFSGLESIIISDAETAFSKKTAQLDFASKIEISEYYIAEIALVDYVDNPLNINNPQSLLKRYVDDKINGHEEELVRLFFAQQKSQKLLDQLYTESVGV